MKSYQQLTIEKRYQIYAFRKSGMSQKEVAEELGCHPSTISRELKRNTGLRGYRPKQADQKSTERRRIASSRRLIDEEVWQQIRCWLMQEWAPEQISGRLKVLYSDRRWQVSHEWIYQFIYHDKKAGGTLYGHLRCQKKRRKRYGSGRSKRGQIKDRIGIDQRPAIVEKRRRIGDWEGDTIIGKSHRQALVSLVERTSRYTVIEKVDFKTATKVTIAILKGMKKHINLCHTITFDNGREFSHHQQLSQQLNADIYFARPYCSWQRGTNENTNGLIRQYAPKKQSFNRISEDDIKQIENKLNHRPRKILNFKTPYEVFYGINPMKKIALRC